MDCETVTVELPDGRTIAVACVRNPRAKRLKLAVNERGARLTLPLRARLATGMAFVRQQREWLGAQWDTYQCAAAPLVPWHTTHLPLRGKYVPLVWMPGKFVELRAQSDALHFYAPVGAKPGAFVRALDDFYRVEARRDLAHWLPGYLPALPQPPARIRLQMMSSQWGSLTGGGTLGVDLALILAEPFAFEYVLVHELCHLIHRDHSPRFWAEVAARCPDWRTARSYLREHGRGLKAQLRALLAPAPIKASD